MDWANILKVHGRFILNCDDYSILDLFTDIYSRFRRVEELFDEN